MAQNRTTSVSFAYITHEITSKTLTKVTKTSLWPKFEICKRKVKSQTFFSTQKCCFHTTSTQKVLKHQFSILCLLLGSGNIFIFFFGFMALSAADLNKLATKISERSRKPSICSPPTSPPPRRENRKRTTCRNHRNTIRQSFLRVCRDKEQYLSRG